MIDQKFLEDIGITDAETIKAITEAYATDIKAEQDAAATIQTQLTAANEKLSSFDGMDVEKIKQEAADWKQKFEQAEADRKAKEYSDNLDKFVQKQSMKNNIYADYLKRQLVEQKLQFDKKGNLTGGDAVVLDLRKNCPEAFEMNPNEPAAAPVSGHVPQAMSNVERLFYEMNPNLKRN